MCAIGTHTTTPERHTNDKVIESGNSEKIVAPKIKKQATIYCPYQGCTSKQRATDKFYLHVRAKHDPELPRLIAAKHIHKSPRGEHLDLHSEHCRNMLAPGERILFEYFNREETPYHCPYKGCTRRSAYKRDLYKHLRNMHDKELPKLTHIGFFTVSDDGWGLKFDENCRDLLDPNDKLKAMEHPKMPDTKCCPYQSCSVSVSESGDLYKHIRKSHDHKYPMLPKKKLVFMTPIGNRIFFDESSRNTLITGQQLRIFDIYGNKVYP